MDGVVGVECRAPKAARYPERMNEFILSRRSKLSYNDAAISNRLQFPSSFQLRPSVGKLSAARSIAFRVLLRASQALDTGSIPVARSRF
jgi:hypothetical protein